MCGISSLHIFFLLLFIHYISVVVERQHLIELPVQYEYVALNNNGQINFHTRFDGSSYNSYYQANQGSATPDHQQQLFSGYQYQVPEAQLTPSGLIRPSIITTTPLPLIPPTLQIAAAAPFAPPGQVEIDPNVIKSLVG